MDGIDEDWEEGGAPGIYFVNSQLYPPQIISVRSGKINLENIFFRKMSVPSERAMEVLW